jgi:hypothetical protein
MYALAGLVGMDGGGGVVFGGNSWRGPGDRRLYLCSGQWRGKRMRVVELRLMQGISEIRRLGIRTRRRLWVLLTCEERVMNQPRSLAVFSWLCRDPSGWWRLWWGRYWLATKNKRDNRWTYNWRHRMETVNRNQRTIGVLWTRYQHSLAAVSCPSIVGIRPCWRIGRASLAAKWLATKGERYNEEWSNSPTGGAKWKPIRKAALL